MSSKTPPVQASNDDDIAIRVENLGKMYRIYDQPVDRLKQLLWGRYRETGYGREFWALQDFSCTVRRGEMLAVIGRNGSGKSTFLQLVAGTLEPTHGQVHLRGRVSALLELGSGFNPEYTGRENVFLAGAILGIDAAEMRQRYDAILTFAGIGDFIDQPVKTYSSGMTARLAFAVASSVDPDILIVDEALAVGDLVFQQRCFRRFKEIRERGATVLFVSHDLGSVVQYCDRAIVLKRGRILAEGSPKAMVDAYKKSLADELSGIDASPGVPKEYSNRKRLCAGLIRNPNCQEFSDGSASIFDWGLANDHGQPMPSIPAGGPVIVQACIVFHQPCPDPIATFTIRDLKGNDLAGSNTLFEDRPIGQVEIGDRVDVQFRINLALRPGNYSLSISCTEYVAEGLAVHHRLYDVLLFEVVGQRRCVGFYDLTPETTVVRSRA